MAVITTDTYLDDGTPRSAGESWTCNGGTLIVRTDSRVHVGAPASMTGTLGSLAASATLGGGYEVDGTNIRWMAYDTGAGNVPAIGDTITGGTSGATGYCLGIWASITSAPSAPGGAAPAIGFIKFREVTGLFQDTEGLTASGGSGFTGNADGADVVGWLELVHDQGTLFTLSRLNEMRVRGDWFDLGLTTGAANQVVQLPTNGSATTYALGIWIANTGSPVSDDDYDFYPAIFIAGMTTTNMGTDERSRFVCMETNGSVRIGHNGTTNVGFVPPAGRAIRIPNVLMRQATTAARATNVIPSPTVGTRPDFTTTGAGVIDWDHCSCDWYTLFAQPYYVRLENVCVERTLNVSECATALDLYDVGMGTTASADTIGLQLTSCFAAGTLEKLAFPRFSTGASDHAVSLTSCIGQTITNCQSGIITYARTTSGVAFFANQCSDLTISGYTQFNGQMTLNTCLDCAVEDLDHVDRYVGATNSSSGVYAISLTNSCSNCSVDGVTFGLSGTIANCHPYLGVFNEATCVDSTFRNLGTRTTFAPGGASNQPAYVYLSGGNNVGTRVQRCYLSPTRTGAISTLNSDKGQTFSNVYGDFADTMVVAALNAIVQNAGGTNTTTGQASVYGTHFWDAFTSDTAGRLILSMNEPTAETVAYVTVVAGTPKFTSAGGITMQAVNDEVIWEQSYYVKGCTGLPNIAPVVTGTNVTYVSGPDWGNHDIYFQIDLNDGNGFNGVWLDLTGANLNSFTASIDPDAGFRLKYRVVCDTASTTNLISYIRISTDSTLVAQTSNLYPLESADVVFSFSGLEVGTEVVLFNSSNVEIDRQVTVSSTYSYPYTWDSNTGNITGVYALIWKDDAYPIKFTGITLGDVSQDIPIDQADDLVYDGALVGTDTTLDPMNLLQIADPGVTSLTVPRIYSEWKNWLLLTNNAQYDFAYTIVGGNTISGPKSIPKYVFQANGWKFRPQEASHELSITEGVLVGQGGSNPFVPTVGAYNVQILFEQPVQAITVSTSGSVAPTQQQIRDAMTLAPTAIPVSGSIDVKIEDVPAELAARIVEGTVTWEQVMRAVLAPSAAKASVPAGAGSFAFRDQADTKDRIAGTIDGSGNRTITTLDLT